MCLLPRLLLPAASFIGGGEHSRESGSAPLRIIDPVLTTGTSRVGVFYIGLPPGGVHGNVRRRSVSFIMVVEKTAGPRLSQGYSRRGQVGKLGRKAGLPPPPNSWAAPLTPGKHLQTKQNTLAPQAERWCCSRRCVRRGNASRSGGGVDGAALAPSAHPSAGSCFIPSRRSRSPSGGAEAGRLLHQLTSAATTPP